MGFNEYSHLVTEMATQNQAIELMSEIIQAYHNRETEMEEKVDQVINLVGGYRFLHMIIPFLDDTKHGFSEMFRSLSDLATKIELAEGTPDDIEFDRAALIPDLSPAKANFKKRVLNLIATYKKQDKQVLMNIPRKVIAASKHAKKKDSSNGPKVVSQK